MAPTNRRRFLQVSACSLAAAAVARGGRAQGPTEKIGVACMGVGGRAEFLVSAFAGEPDVDLVALADVDSRRLPAAADKVGQRTGRVPQTFQDFRRLLDLPEVDVLVVGTPDHWHAIPTILACQAGKDVYVEKPDGHNALEGQRMVAAQRKHGRVVQLGTQSRSAPHFQAAMEYIRAGKLGRVLVAKAWENARQGAIGHPSDGPPPEGVDYDLWLGPAPQRPFNPARFHGNWRWFFDYGTGDLGNDGVHRLDVARWALHAAAQAEGETLPAVPATISALGGKWYFDDAQEWPDTLQVSYQFAGGAAGRPGRVLTYEMRIWAPYHYHDESEGVMVYGDQGCMVLSNNRWRAFGPGMKQVADGSGDNSGALHVRNFLDCVKSRGVPNADLATVGHPASLVVHAGNVAWRVGRQLTLDAASETFVGDEEANRLRTRPEYRAPWLLPEV
jgi:predicted dehydrogenase